MSNSFFILDTETGSLQGGVCEIAWLQVDENLTVLAEFHSLVNPERPIEEGAKAIHGISDSDVEFAPTMSEIATKIPAGINLIGHNCSFDMRMIKPHIVPVRALCTLELARTYVKGTTNHKLETLQKELNLPLQKSHSALGDVHTTRDLLVHILPLTGVSLEILFQRQAEPKILSKMPFGKHKGKTMLQVPREYRNWLLTQEIDANLKFTLEKLRTL